MLIERIDNAGVNVTSVLSALRKVIGYLRVSTEQQASAGHGLDAQRHAIQRRADNEGWHVT